MNTGQDGYCGIWLGVMKSAEVQHRQDILLFYGKNTVDIIAD
ncbi:hypothetical protein ACF3VQ_10620 [Yersinia sp. HM-2024]